MKRKYLSLFTAVTSLMMVATYVVLGVLMVIRVANGKEYTPTVEENLWIVQVLERVKKAGFNIFFSIMGIILASILAFYRVMLSYFYFKIYRSSADFYKARLGDIILYSLLAVVMAVVSGWLSFGEKGIMPIEVQPVILIAFICYIVVASLPLIEIFIVNLIILLARKTAEQVPVRGDIVDELDNLADKTAFEMAVKPEEIKPEVTEVKPEGANTITVSQPEDVKTVETEIKTEQTKIVEVEISKEEKNEDKKDAPTE